MKMMIDKQYIEELVEKFMDGGTSLDEERMLYRYFSSDNIDESLLHGRTISPQWELYKSQQTKP